METVHSGGRPLTRAALAGRRRALDEGRTISRKELSAAAREASKALRLRVSLRGLLSALCAVWGEQPWERLLVWPSNEHLIAMTGLSERALRYGLKALVDLELITPKDSSNGKRFAIRAPGGAIVDAFGFDLTPVVARRGEWAERLAAAAAETERRRRAFDLLTCHKRAVAEALRVTKERFDEVETADLDAARTALEETSPKRRTSGIDPETVLEAWGELRQLVEERFYAAACAGNPCPHVETDNGSPSEPCTTATRVGAGDDVVLDPGLVAAACPVAADLGTPLRTEMDVVEAGRLMRGAIGAHPSAWSEACDALGPYRAATLVLIVAQLHEDESRRGRGEIRNPGGYFRQLARLTAEGRYGISAELTSMRRRRMI